jgi:hypothetical protein
MPSAPTKLPLVPACRSPPSSSIHRCSYHGPSCGQDLAFHLQSWLDAAQPTPPRHPLPPLGHHRRLERRRTPLPLLPAALLAARRPPHPHLPHHRLCPTIFIAIALLLAGFTFHKLASEFASPNAALIASTLYLANPYMLFTAFERTALAELLAAAWIPLLSSPSLRPAPTDLPLPFAPSEASPSR